MQRTHKPGPKKPGLNKSGPYKPGFNKPGPKKPFQKGGGPPPREGAGARLVALNVLQDVARQDAYASLALSKRLRESTLPQRDRDLVTELVYGTLERRIALDYVIDRRLERKDVESVVRDILRMGVYQLLYLTRIPESAAVDESVKLARMLDRGAFTGLVNGVLRGIAREKDEIPWPGEAEDPVLALSVRHSLPGWMVRRFIDAYGFETAEAIAAYRPAERFITIRRTPGRMEQAAFEAMMAEKGWDFQPARVADAYLVSGIGDVGLDKAFLQGLYSVQGEGSILAALAVSPKRGAIVLDACAAPGGKTACLAHAMGETGRVHAWDIHEHRAELIRSMAQRLKLDTVRPAVRDATVVREDLAETMDAVLVDAPCSGLGVMLQKPDVKYRQSEETVSSVAAVQKALLSACSRYVRPGGVLVYSTCTLLPEENADQVKDFLRRHPTFAPDTEGLRAALPAFLQDRVEDGCVQLLPHLDRMEGFFIARMKRTIG